MIDKHLSVVQYLLNCPKLRNNPLYFNYAQARDESGQILTSAEDSDFDRKYVDGSKGKIFTFTLNVFKSMTDDAIVKTGDFSNENIDDIMDMQGLIDWITEQEELRNYPDFGEQCIVESISTTSETPRFEGVDDSVLPPLAIYSVVIRVDYIDYSKVVWK